MELTDSLINKWDSSHSTNWYVLCAFFSSFFFQIAIVLLTDLLIVGETFVTGLSESYDEDCYDKNVLGKYIS